MLKEQESISNHSQAIPYYTQLYTALARASLKVFLATLGHNPPCPAKEVKENTLQKGRTLLSSNPKDRKTKSFNTDRY